MAGSSSASDREAILGHSGTVAGFFRHEWVRSLALTMDIAAAEEAVATMFAAQRDDSFGFAFPVGTWALLALAGEDCERRVRILTRGYGDDFIAELDALIDGYRKLADTRQIRELWKAARQAYCAGDDAALARMGLTRR